MIGNGDGQTGDDAGRTAEELLLSPSVEALLGDDPAPSGWSEVATLLRQAGDVEACADPDPELLAALVAAVADPTTARPTRRLGGARTVGLAVAAAAALLGGGSAAAAAGRLPDPLQSVVHDVVAVVGLHVPDGPPTSGGSQDGPGHGRSDEAPGRPAVPGRPAEPGRADEAPGRPFAPGESDEAPGRGPSTGGGPPSSLPAPATEHGSSLPPSTVPTASSVVPAAGATTPAAERGGGKADRPGETGHDG